MNNLLKRFLQGLVCAIPAAGLALFFSGASASAQPLPQPAPDCSACHADMTDLWARGKHGQAAANPVFAQAWEAQGKPGACLTCHSTGYDPQAGTWSSEAITCAACHPNVPAAHPKENAPVPAGNAACVTCHSDPRFGEQWRSSAHYQMNMKCSACHDPHTTGMRHAPGSTTPASPAALCENCHRNYAQSYPQSSHARAGIDCAGCHLDINDADRAAHSAPDHSFTAKVESCNSCHSFSMHSPAGGPALDANLGQLDMSLIVAAGDEEAQKTPILAQPFAVSPLGFSSLAGLLGLASGMVLAPWLERLYRSLTKGGKNVDVESP